jgi:hypothetical protein
MDAHGIGRNIFLFRASFDRGLACYDFLAGEDCGDLLESGSWSAAV